MEIKLNHFLLLFMSVTLMGFNTNAQTYEQIQIAFEASYENETKGEYSRAIDDLKAVYNEESYEINLRLGWLHYMSGLFTESTTYYSKAIQLMPYSIEARLGYAYPASAKGNWDQVEKQYREILKIDSKNYTANYRMGLIKYGKEDYAGAFQFFEVVTNLYPFDYDLTIMLGWCNYKLGKLREAKVLFNKALMIRPNDGSALEGLSYIQ